jgi:hypothetical protein
MLLHVRSEGKNIITLLEVDVRNTKNLSIFGTTENPDLPFWTKMKYQLFLLKRHTKFYLKNLQSKHSWFNRLYNDLNSEKTVLYFVGSN